MNAVVLTEHERWLLQDVARETESHPKFDGGWVVYGVPYGRGDKPAWAPWGLYKTLVERGLLETFEDWKNVYVRLTDAGWAALAAQDGAA